MIPYGRGDLKRALILCGVVGTWLVLLNQGYELASGRITAMLQLRIIADYATPFAVSSFTGVMRNWGKRKGIT
jgi:hypothetical protein